MNPDLPPDDLPSDLARELRSLQPLPLDAGTASAIAQQLETAPLSLPDRCLLCAIFLGSIAATVIVALSALFLTTTPPTAAPLSARDTVFVFNRPDEMAQLDAPPAAPVATRAAPL